MRRVVFHLLNDYSGSPKVLRGVIERMLAAGDEVCLYTSSGGPLDLLDSPNLQKKVIPYRFSRHRWLTFVRFAWAQLLSFFFALRYAFSKDTDFYINTILPVGAALGARVAGHRITVHCHETMKAKIWPYQAMTGLMLRMADRVVCVSKYQADSLIRRFGKIEHVDIIPNTLRNDFIASLHPDPERAYVRRNVLMLTSLKEYKGMREFLELARLRPDYRFTMVVNDTRKAIDKWLASNNIIPGQNVSIYTRQSDVAPFYNDASIVVNLSDPQLFIESFGMTVLEAKAAGLPVVAPPVGGVTELVKDGTDGMLIECHDTTRLIGAIDALLSDRPLYLRMAKAALGHQTPVRHKSVALERL